MKPPLLFPARILHTGNLAALAPRVYFRAMRLSTAILLFTSCCTAAASKNVAYIHGDVAADGAIPSGTAAPYDPMLLTDTGDKGLSQFKALVEDQGYAVSQHYDQATTLDTSFLEPLDVIVFGLHQKTWSAAEKVTLKFAETYWNAAGKRVFDIALEGSPVIDDLDLCAAAPGKRAAYDLQFPVTVSDGELNITASASVNNALLNAIVILPD